MKIKTENSILLKISETNDVKDLTMLLVKLVKSKVHADYIRTAMNKLLSLRKR